MAHQTLVSRFIYRLLKKSERAKTRARKTYKKTNVCVCYYQKDSLFFWAIRFLYPLQPFHRLHNVWKSITKRNALSLVWRAPFFVNAVNFKSFTERESVWRCKFPLLPPSGRFVSKLDLYTWTVALWWLPCRSISYSISRCFVSITRAGGKLASFRCDTPSFGDSLFAYTLAAIYLPLF